MTEHDFERTARAWLDDGPNTMSDRPLEAALAEIHVTPQRRAVWPARRFPQMFNLARFATVTAGLAVAAVVGLSLLPGTGVGGPPATPTPTPSPSPMLLDGDWDGRPALQPGTYVTDPDFQVGVTFTVPAGWEGKVGGPYYVELGPPDEVRVAFHLVTDVYADPCREFEGLLEPPPGPTVNDFATALRSMRGISATNPIDVTVDGYSGQELTLTAPDSSDTCRPSGDGDYPIWRLPLGGIRGMLPGEVATVQILDVEGERLVIDAEERPGYDEGRRDEVQAVLDSIQIAP